jgi:hypothetical protein
MSCFLVIFNLVNGENFPCATSVVRIEVLVDSTLYVAKQFIYLYYNPFLNNIVLITYLFLDEPFIFGKLFL